MRRAQPGLKFYGTDMGLSYEHDGKLWMLFGDTWPSADNICTAPRPTNDDTMATLPLESPGALPALEFRTLSGSPDDLGHIQVMRGTESLDMGFGKAPLAAFSDGKHAYAFFERMEPYHCDAPYAKGRSTCPTDDHFECSKGLGTCEPAYITFPTVCDAERREGCLPGQTCTPAVLCVDPSSSQYVGGHFTSQERSVAHAVELGLSRVASPETFDSVLTWPTNKFSIPATRTVARFTGTRDGNDFGTGHDTVLVWGRPDLTAEHERDGYLYLMTHRLPLPLDTSGQLEFAPRYFAGVDAGTGEPRWSSHESEAQGIALDGKLNGDPHEPVQVLTSMTVSWLGAPINKWMMLYGGDLADFLLLDPLTSRNQHAPGAIWARFADEPWGPFSPPVSHLAPGNPVTVDDPYGPGGFMYSPQCVSGSVSVSVSGGACAASDPHRPLDTAVPGCLLALEDPGRLYSPNIIDPYTRPNAGGGLDVFWNASTWNPYAVRLFKTSIQPPGNAPRPLDELADAAALERLSSWTSLPVLGDVRRHTQQSSHDRSEDDGVFPFPLTAHGNRDFNNFVCASADADLAANQLVPFQFDVPTCPESYVHGAVLSRFEGPGHLVRLWLGMRSLETAPADREVLRIYVDDEPRPRVDVPLVEALDGRAGEIFAPPFGAGSTSRLAWYYPVTFQKKLIVALDRLGENDFYYFHSDVVSDVPGKPAASRERRPERDAAIAQLEAVFHPSGTPAALSDAIEVKLAPGAVRRVPLTGPGTLQELQVRVLDADYASLAQVRLQVRWDGASTPSIDVPLSDLFGGSVAPERSSLALTSLHEGSNRLLTLKLPMPFRERADFSLTNTGKTAVAFVLRFGGLHTLPAEPFGRLHVQRTETVGPTTAAERIAVSASGRGRLVGVCSEVAGHADPGAGVQADPLNLLEGDVHATVDGALSLNGTGSEEYADDVFYFRDAPHGNAFAQAWGVRAGRASFCRWHVLGTELDFEKSLQLTFELGGAGNPAVVDRHKTVSYLYLAD
jgi:hypothetical protein